MITDLKYMPIFRARQQEIIVLKETEFGPSIFPLIEIIKEKDRKNNARTSLEIYSDLIENVNSEKVFIDLPIYTRLSNSTNNEVVTFRHSVSNDTDKRSDFLNSFHGMDKVIPVISSLLLSTGDLNTIIPQFESLKDNYPCIAFRTFHNTFEKDIDEIEKCLRPETDILIYDLDTIPVTSPVLRVHKKRIQNLKTLVNVLVRSAVNTDIQNVTLQHGEVISEADNSIAEYFLREGFNAFGDYVGIKKDDMTSGGTISPGFIMYDPYENWYYGFKGNIKSLSEFENTIVPDVLNSDFIKRLVDSFPIFIKNNLGYRTLERINNGEESGKSQAKFKKIAMEHYLHCMIESFAHNQSIPLSAVNN